MAAPQASSEDAPRVGCREGKQLLSTFRTDCGEVWLQDLPSGPPGHSPCVWGGEGHAQHVGNTHPVNRTPTPQSWPAPRPCRKPVGTGQLSAPHHCPPEGPLCLR